MRVIVTIILVLALIISIGAGIGIAALLVALFEDPASIGRFFGEIARGFEEVR